MTSDLKGKDLICQKSEYLKSLFRRFGTRYIFLILIWLFRSYVFRNIFGMGKNQHNVLLVHIIGCTDFYFFHIFLNANPLMVAYGPKEYKNSKKKVLRSSHPRQAYLNGVCAILLRLYTSTEGLKRVYTSPGPLLEIDYFT